MLSVAEMGGHKASGNFELSLSKQELTVGRYWWLYLHGFSAVGPCPATASSGHTHIFSVLLTIGAFLSRTRIVFHGRMTWWSPAAAAMAVYCKRFEQMGLWNPQTVYMHTCTCTLLHLNTGNECHRFHAFYRSPKCICRLQSQSTVTLYLNKFLIWTSSLLEYNEYTYSTEKLADIAMSVWYGAWTVSLTNE